MGEDRPAIIPVAQGGAAFEGVIEQMGQSDWNRLPYGHPLNPFSAHGRRVSVIYGQSSERVEGRPICGKAKDGPNG